MIRVLPLFTVAACVASAGCRTSMSPDASAPEREPGIAYGNLLQEVVTDDGLVDYDALEADREPLDRYVAWLAAEPVRGRPPDRHAFWLNAYNALVLFQVLERGRPASVLDVDGWIPVDGSGFFYETQFEIEGEWLSLSEIEHERIRWMEMDLRDHAAINCASRSCPPLRPELYRQNQLDRQLKEQMGRWVDDDARGVRIEGEGSDAVAVFNPIFDWYERDFEFFSVGKSPCAVAAMFASGEKAAALTALDARGCPRSFSEYDWRLNDASAE